MKLFSCIREWPGYAQKILFLLLVSLGIKVPALFWGDIINVDGVRYIDAAQQFAQGNFLEGLRIDWMPFYSLLIAGFHFLVRDWVLAGQLISLFTMVLVLIPFYLLTKGLFDEKVAFWTGLAFALSPMFNKHSVDLLRDPIFIFFFVCSVYFYLRALRTQKILFLSLATLSSIFALCCRLEAILLWGIFLPVLAGLAMRNRSERRFLLKGMFVVVCIPLLLGLLFGGGALLATGLGVAPSVQTGKLTGQLKEVVAGNSVSYYKRKVSKGLLENYQNRYVKLKELARTLPNWDRTGGVLETTRHYMPLIYLIGAVEAMARNLFPLFVIPLLVGLRNRTNWNRGHWFVLLLVGAYFLMAYTFLIAHDAISKRYILVPALLLFPWVGVGLERIWRTIIRGRWPRSAMVIFLMIFCVVPAYKSMGDFTGPRKGDVIRKAGQWLTDQPDLKEAVIACSEPRIRFYSSPDLNYLKSMEKFKVARNFSRMETVAFENKADLLIIETSKKQRHHIPDFKRFTLLKEFAGIKNDVLIFSRNNYIQEIGQ